MCIRDRNSAIAMRQSVAIRPSTNSGQEMAMAIAGPVIRCLSLIHISEPTRPY